jgi:hypothetical protein
MPLAEPLKPQEGRVSILRSYQTREREKVEHRSIEIQIQEELFPRFRAWILTRLIQDGHLTVKEAIYGGSMYLKRIWHHGSADTTREWLNELCSNEGEFEVFDPPYENLGPCVRQKTPELEKELRKAQTGL